MLKVSNLLVTSIFSTLLVFPLTLKAEEHPLVGVNYPPLPEEAKEIAGWVIEAPYSISQIDVDGQELLLLTRLIRRDSKGNPFFKVVNVLSLPPINTEIEYLMPGALCTVNGSEKLNFLAIVKLENDKPYFTKASKAWRVEGENFVEINPQSVNFQCENYGYGL